MPARPSLLLIEAMDALGSHEGDATLRVAALKPLAGPARALALPWRAEGNGGAGEGSPRDARALAAAIATHRCDRVVIASGRDAAAELARALPREVDARWWPTAIEDSPPGRAPAPPVFAAPPAAPEPLALTHAVIAALPVRERVPLWDGDFVLAAAPLDGEDGRRLIQAFAAVAEDRAGVDLVVLADPQPEFEAHARSLGIGPRTHFAGPAPRGAEPTWLTSASAVLLASPRPLSAGWVLRVLAAGAPLLPIGGGAVARGVASWLEAHGAHPAPESARNDAATALAAVLEAGAGVGRARSAGREAAAAHQLGAWKARLASPWGEPGRDARKVA